MQPIELTKLSLTELKALAYDVAAQIESLQRNMQVINQEISKRIVEEQKVSPKKELVKK